MAASGFIKLFRQMTEWEWYQDVPVTKLFLHLLLIANYEDKRWKGIVVQRGQVSVSLAFLAMGSGLSVQQVRTALSKLESTGEITKRATNGFTLITICKYVDYQFIDNTYQQTDNKQIANEQQTDNIQTTIQKQTDNTQITTTKEIKNIRNNISTTTTTISRESNEKWMAELERTETESFSTICLGLKINNETYFEFLEGFKRECKMQDTIHLSWSDTRKHFIGWCRCEMDRRSKQNKNGNNNANSQSNSRRYWYEPTGEEDYSGDTL